MSSTERKARLKEVDFSEGGSTRGVSTSSRVGRPDKRFEFAITSFSLFFFFLFYLKNTSVCPNGQVSQDFTMEA